MRNIKKLLSLCVTFFIFCVSSHVHSSPESTSINWRPWSESIFQEAQKSDRLIFLYNKASWCQWCHKMDATTYTDSNVIQLLNSKFLPVRIDIEKNSDISSRYQVKELPTSIVLTSDNRILLNLSGYIPPDTLLMKLRQLNIPTQTASIPVKPAQQVASLSSWHITIIGEKNDPKAKSLYLSASKYVPSGATVFWYTLEEAAAHDPDIKYPQLKEAAAFVCINKHCSLPLFNPKYIGVILTELNSYANDMGPAHQPSQFMNTIKEYQNTAKLTLQKNNFLTTLLFFWFAGILLAFTPCVLPLIIIIAGFLGAKDDIRSRGQAFRLSLAYVLSLSLTYSATGIITAYFGIYMQPYFQNAWVLSLFSLLFVLLALSLLGVYTINIPESWRKVIVKYNHYHTHYSYIQVILMGILATLIASPCVAAPLVGVLGYVAGTGDMLIGGASLFALGLGVGTPLLIATTLSIRLLRDSTEWQLLIKTLFGLTLMGVAIWLIRNLIPGSWIMMLWSALTIYGAIYMQNTYKNEKGNFGIFWRTLSLMVLVYGIVLFIGEIMGNTNPLTPLQTLTRGNAAPETMKISYLPVRNLPELDNILTLAKIRKKPVMISFSASWCISCEEMEKTLESFKVLAILQNFILIKVDLTTMDAGLMQIAQKYGVISAPAILFLDQDGTLLDVSIDANMSADNIAKLLQLILAKNA